MKAWTKQLLFRYLLWFFLIFFCKSHAWNLRLQWETSFFSEQWVVGRGASAWKSALLLGAEYFPTLFGTQGREGISNKVFHYLGHLGSGAGAQNILVRQIHGCLFKISLFTVPCRFYSRRDAKSWHQEKNWLRAVHEGHWGFEHFKIKKEPENSTLKFLKTCYWRTDEHLECFLQSVSHAKPFLRYLLQKVNIAVQNNLKWALIMPGLSAEHTQNEKWKAGRQFICWTNGNSEKGLHLKIPRSAFEFGELKGRK